MTQPIITGSAILSTLRTTLEPFPFVHAMWEGGAAAFGRMEE